LGWHRGKLKIHTRYFLCRFLELNMAFKVYCTILLIIPGVLCLCGNPESFPDQDTSGEQICAILFNVSCQLHANNCSWIIKSIWRRNIELNIFPSFFRRKIVLVKKLTHTQEQRHLWLHHLFWEKCKYLLRLTPIG